jgi:hypothetical protein
MPDNPTAVIAYICECGKKWTFQKKNTTGKRSVKCDCGRYIMIDEGLIYSTAKEGGRATR